MKLTREKCIKSFNSIYSIKSYPLNTSSNDEEIEEVPFGELFKEELDVFNQLIHEYFDNPPLKFEEIEAGMWVWRDESKSWMKVYETYIADYGDNLFYEGTKVIIFISNSRLTFSSNYDKEKYYRKQVVKNE